MIEALKIIQFALRMRYFRKPQSNRMHEVVIKAKENHQLDIQETIVY